MSNYSAGKAEVSSCIVVQLAVQFCSFDRPCEKKTLNEFSDARKLSERKQILEKFPLKKMVRQNN
jgi:hypothetical protein